MSSRSTIDDLRWNALLPPFPHLPSTATTETRVIRALRRRAAACAERRIIAGLTPAEADPASLHAWKRESDRHDRLITALLRQLRTP
jgi:hypothetical protein